MSGRLDSKWIGNPSLPRKAGARDRGQDQDASHSGLVSP